MTTRSDGFEVTVTNILLRKRRCCSECPSNLVALVVQPEDQLALGVTNTQIEEFPGPVQSGRPQQAQQCLPKPVTGCFCKTETLHDD